MTNATDTILDATAAMVDAHLSAYGEPDPTRRAELIERSWAADGSLVDPPLDPASGHAALDALFATVQSHYPGHTFRRVTVVDVHHELARYGWEMVAPDGSVALAGTDVVELAADGRLARVVGFFGDLAPADA
jgi:hypothetical protein